MRSDEVSRIATLTYSTQPRGGVAHALSVSEALVRAGHAVRLYAVDRPGARFSREPQCDARVIDVDVVEERLYDFVSRRSDALVLALERQGKNFDVFHAHDGITADALRRLVERGAIGSYVRTVHHLDGYGDPRVDEIERRSIESASRVFVVSPSWQTELHSRYGIAADSVGNGVDLARFFPASKAAVHDPARPRFLTIGGIEIRKNTIAIVEAFALVKGRIPGAHLTIAGGASVLDHAPYRRAFATRLRELELVADVDVTLAGRTSDAEILALLQAADAFVFPSLVEGFGLVVLEAAACGIPVVVSNSAPFTDYLAPADAIFVEPSQADSIARGMHAALDPLSVKRSCERGPLVARGHDWRSVANAYLRGYRA